MIERWEIGGVPFKLLEHIEGVEQLLNGEPIEKKFIINRVAELRLNAVWLRYLAETSETPHLDSDARDQMRLRIFGYIQIIEDLLQLYYSFVKGS